MKETRLDLRGLNCPLPVLRAAKAMRAIEIGDVLVLECTDPLAAIDVPLFASKAGHEMLSEERNGDLLIFRLARGR
jgi:tRNA 2-thiouridine synthesizing protein A